MVRLHAPVLKRLPLYRDHNRRSETPQGPQCRKRIRICPGSPPGEAGRLYGIGKSIRRLHLGIFCEIPQPGREARSGQELEGKKTVESANLYRCTLSRKRVHHSRGCHAPFPRNGCFESLFLDHPTAQARPGGVYFFRSSQARGGCLRHPLPRGRQPNPGIPYGHFRKFARASPQLQE